MLRRQVFALGWDRLPPRCDGVAFRSTAMDTLPAVLGNCPEGAVLLLGGDSLRRLDPRAIAGLAPSPICLPIGLLDRRDDALVARWARATSITFATWGDLPAILRAAMETPIRPAVEPELWMPTAHGPRPTAHGPRPTAKGAPSRRLFGSFPICDP